ALEKQTFPLQQMEVIVVADGCNDTTIEMLKKHKATYALQFIDQLGQGPAVARNKGAALANGTLLLFIDDDIEPSVDLIAAHVNAHKIKNRVVIGYLPFVIPKRAGFYHLGLWSWWEDKFHEMRNPGYWYNFEDLLSGSFSLPAKLFHQVNGFDSTFRCREDYELGLRLIKAGTNFHFCEKAWGYHRDTVTNLNRSLQRKRQEGKADIRSGRLHPDLIIRLNRLMQLKGPFTKSQSLMHFFVFNMPALADAAAAGLQRWMDILEWFRIRSAWRKWNDRLHDYWYLRGVADELRSQKKLNTYFQENLTNATPVDIVEIDLKKGLSEAEAFLDKERPVTARLLYGHHVVGDFPFWPGAERLRGAHLRLMLSTTLSWPMMEALAFEKTLLQTTENPQELYYGKMD
ncbi:MAG: glycosyltransferase family 2 protein, partial [Bacteroidota bacterium]|nr:glycosyltransferase family 2 protein [Bacteroidota bacterium]